METEKPTERIKKNKTLTESEKKRRSDISKLIKSASPKDIEETWIPAIMKNQEEDELDGKTKKDNSIGLNRDDSEPITNYYNIIYNGDNLTPDQIKDTKERLCKYWRQFDGIENRYPTVEAAEEQQEKPKSSLHIDISKEILSFLPIITLRDNIDEMYFYENGVYKPNADAQIREISQSLLQDKTKTRVIEEVIYYIQNATFVNRDEINSNLNYINLKNGLYNLQTKKLEPHNPKIISTIQIPVNYNPKAECPEISNFLCEILKQEDVFLMLQIFGYCLIPDYSIQKAVMLNGDGLNGKGTLGRLLCAFVGNENKSSESLKALNTDKFSSSNLYGKLVNIDTDLSDSAIYDDTTFKKLTGGDTISAQRKFQNAFNFRNFARMFFGCNHIPPHPKGGYAWMRRWLLIDFPVQFSENEDKNLDSKLQTPQELSGLLNLSIDALHWLLETKSFFYKKTPEEVGTDYLMKSNSVIAFMTEMTEASDDYVTTNELYQTYLQWAKYKKLKKIEPINKFGKLLKNASYSGSRHMIDEKQVYCYDSICFIPDKLSLLGNPTSAQLQENKEAYTHWYTKSDPTCWGSWAHLQINYPEKICYIEYNGIVIDIYMEKCPASPASPATPTTIVDKPVTELNNTVTEIKETPKNPVNVFNLISIKALVDIPIRKCIDGITRPAINMGSIFYYPAHDAMELIQSHKAEELK